MEYEVRFGHMIIQANSPEEAESKVVEEVQNGNLEIESIEEI